MESMNHISHLHPLHLTEVDDAADASPPLCHACGSPWASSSTYQCAPCRYVLHRACACAAKTVRHPAHPEHPLSLLLASPYEHGSQACDACGGGIGGHSFHCEQCGYDLHLPCADLPDAVTAPGHAHPLKLAYEDPLKGNGSLCICDVCSEGCSTAQWFYWCEGCDFQAHVGCAVPDTPAAQLYPAINVEKMRDVAAVEEEAAKTAALLQQYQQMSALISAQSSVFARNTASMAAGMQSMAVRASDDNLEINFNRAGEQEERRVLRAGKNFIATLYVQDFPKCHRSVHDKNK